MIGVFSIVGIFIIVVAGLVFFGAISTLLGHRKIMNQVTEQVFRQARDGQPGTAATASSTGMAASASPGSADYSCDNCGAALANDTEISPSGDFKCQYCNSWSNTNN